MFKIIPLSLKEEIEKRIDQKVKDKGIELSDDLKLSWYNQLCFEYDIRGYIPDFDIISNVSH